MATTIVKKYLDAFDDMEIINVSTTPVLIDDMCDEVNNVCDAEVAEQKYDEMLEANAESEWTAEDDDNVPYEVTFVDDLEYGNGETYQRVREAKEDEKILHEVHLSILNEKYKTALEECNEVLKNKLVWLSSTANQASDTQHMVTTNEYPMLGHVPKAAPKTARTTIDKNTVYKPFNVCVQFANTRDAPIVFKRQELCPNIDQGIQCPNGHACEYTHTPKKPYCNKGHRCVNRNCTFFHPSSHLVRRMQNKITIGNQQFGTNTHGTHGTHGRNDRACGDANKSGDANKVRDADKLCMYINNGQECPFGDKCKFSHKPKRARCNKGASCVNKKCTFFHPQNERVPSSPNRHTITTGGSEMIKFKKAWFCKALLQNGYCRFGDNCRNAHTEAEVAANVTKCRFGNYCNMVTFQPNGTVCNKGDRPCGRLHPSESVSEFIKRVQ